MVIQFLLSFFILFALSRVVLQLRQGKLTIGSFLFWSGLFIFALFGVLNPDFTAYAASFLGIGRGADVVVYISIALLFYLIFRLSIAVEEARREITDLVRRLALDHKKKKDTKRGRKS